MGSQDIQQKPGKKQKVLEIIKEMVYKPNAIARGLVNKRTNTIGVLLPSLSSRLASELLKGIENSAHNMDYSVIICDTESDGKRTIEYLDVLSEKQIDGIIITGSLHRTLTEIGQLIFFKQKRNQ